jgi:hypothetical protein
LNFLCSMFKKANEIKYLRELFFEMNSLSNGYKSCLIRFFICRQKLICSAEFSKESNRWN